MYCLQYDSVQPFRVFAICKYQFAFQQIASTVWRATSLAPLKPWRVCARGIALLGSRMFAICKCRVRTTTR
jgi:hypothetical protein